MIYGDLEFLIENTDGWRNNPGISSTTKLGEIFYQIFPCLQYCHIKACKISVMYTEVKAA